MTPVQARMARAALNLSQQQVCEILKINRTTLVLAEKKPVSTRISMQIKQYYIEHGITFFSNEMGDGILISKK